MMDFWSLYTLALCLMFIVLGLYAWLLGEVKVGVLVVGAVIAVTPYANVGAFLLLVMLGIWGCVLELFARYGHRTIRIR